MLHPALQDKISRLQQEQVPPARQARLQPLIDSLRRRREAGQPLTLHFICTHNSRRSQLGQAWAAAAAASVGALKVQTHSGGTEATAFFPSAVEALRRAGFGIERQAPGQRAKAEMGSPDNPRYLVTIGPEERALVCYSKRFDDPSCPQANFIAVMTCGEADQTCPVIPGAERIALLYEDPKVADGTAEEAARYDERSDQIGRELLWVFSELNKA